MLSRCLNLCVVDFPERIPGLVENPSKYMGKGGGCFPSKIKAPDQQDAPISWSQRSISIHGQSPRISSASTPAVSQRKLRIFIVFYSMYRHVETLARKIKKGVDGVEGIEGVLYRVPETLAPQTLEQMKAPPKDDSIPVISAEQLVEADGLLFGFPTRYGCMAAQMKAFFDSSGALWREQKLAGVPAGFFVSTGTQGGGQETSA